MQIEGVLDQRVNAPSVAITLAASWLAPAETSAIAPEWSDLAANAAEPNPFYAPPLLAPALAAFADGRVKIAVLRGDGGRLLALAPISPMRGYSRLPVGYGATWMHQHCFFAAPLIRRRCEREALRALFDLVEREGAFFRLRHLDRDGAIFKAAREVAAETGRLSAPSALYERALLRGGYRTDVYLEEALRGKKRKELRRLRARLEQEGAVVFEALTDKNQLSAWTCEFLALESAGWKGREKTALASTPEGAAFFCRALEGAFDAGSLLFYRLTVGGRAISMIVNFIGSGAAYSFKIAHDESYARYSPGVMLEIEMMKALEGNTDLAFIDSCAKADHPMINSLWRDRRAIAALNISRRDAPSKLLFRVLMGLERFGERRRNGGAGNAGL